MKILIVEDEKPLRESIRQYLDYQGYVCETAENFPGALDKIREFGYDCIIVDIGLPGGSGLDLVSALKNEESKAGIIIISARNALDDRIRGLELGSDDYLTKPFHLSELSARVAAILRRRKFSGSRVIRFNEIVLDTEGRSLTVDDKRIDLTEKEYLLIEYMLSNQRRVLTKPAIAEHVWGDDYAQAGEYDFLYTHIKNLRKKLLEAGSGDYIKTVHGTGYRLTDNQQ